jgi:hypothetical protein
MNFAVSDPELAAVCREHFRLALEGPEVAADVDAAVQTPNTKAGKTCADRKSLDN